MSIDNNGNILMLSSSNKIFRIFGKTIIKPISNICIVSVDSSTNKNVIAWERQEKLGVSKYRIYKESTVVGKYILLDSVDYMQEGVYIDNSSNPQVKSDKYIMSIVDSNNYVTPFSAPFQTMNLQINTSITNTPNLLWSAFVGFDFSTYYIYRIFNGELNLIDSVNSSVLQYNDTIHLSAGNISYLVSVRKIGGCDPNTIKSGKTEGKLYGESISNIKSAPTTTNINENSFEGNVSVYPNPAKDRISIDVGNYANMRAYILKITNTLGQEVWKSNISQASFTLDLNSFGGKGTYFVSISNNQGEILDVRKIVLQ